MSQRLRQAILQRDYARLDESGLDAAQVTRYLSVLARLAAVDDVSVGEHVLVERIAEFLGASEEHLARAFLTAEDRAVSTAALLAGIPDRGLRVCLLRDAYRIAAADHEITPSESEQLASLAAGLGLTVPVAADVRMLALQEVRIQREFHALVRQAEAEQGP
jgi:uncharacterized tellurite resistance protein B-like protein